MTTLESKVVSIERRLEELEETVEILGDKETTRSIAKGSQGSEGRAVPNLQGRRQPRQGNKARLSYLLVSTTNFERGMRRLSSGDLKRSRDVLNEIARDPYSFKELWGKFRGLRSARFGGHRIIYAIEGEKKQSHRRSTVAPAKPSKLTAATLVPVGSLTAFMAPAKAISLCAGRAIRTLKLP